jgi:DNA-binding response OmpR family regulator
MADQSPCRVLVVDDSQDTAQALAIVLRQNGNEVDVATDGLKAVQRAAFFTPDVVLLDLGLPWLHGHDVCRQILQRAERKPLMIAITGHSGSRKESLDAGFDEHLIKPIDFAKLTTLVDQFCASRRKN